MARLDALVTGERGPTPMTVTGDRHKATREETFETPFQSTMDELYWSCAGCRRTRLALHGAWIRGQAAPVRSRHQGALRIRRDGDRNTVHAKVRRIAFRAELLRCSADGRLFGVADRAGCRAAEERPQQEMQPIASGR